MAKDWYKSGDWNALCDVCGFKRKSSQLTERWDGLMVCKLSVKPGCFETRHPQELIRPPKGESKLPWTRPEAPDAWWYNQAINCDLLDFQFLDRLAFEATTDFTITKVTVRGPLTIVPTVTVVCTLEVTD